MRIRNRRGILMLPLWAFVAACVYTAALVGAMLWDWSH
jgi:hypothetical protein